MRWDELTSPQISELDRSIPVVLPVSATEQHGPHLPVATDRMIGEFFCGRLNDSIQNDVLILPIMAVGCSEHHMSFAGTLTLEHTTFLNGMEDILRSVSSHGFRNLVVLNSHGGNLGIGQVMVEHLGGRLPDCQLVFTAWWRLALEELAKITETGPGGVGHACEFETSLMMVIAPHLVHEDKIEAGGNQPTYEWAEGDLLRGSKASLYRSFKEMTTNGAYGDARAASAEKGERIAKVVIEALRGLIADLRK